MSRSISGKCNTPSTVRNRPRLVPLALLVCAAAWILQGCTHIERRRDTAGQQLGKLARELDSFFAEPRAEEEYRDTRLKLSGYVSFDEEGDYKISGKSNVKLPLPGLRNRFGLLIGGQSDRDDIDIETLDAEDSNYESFLRFFTRDTKEVDWDLDVGLKYSSEIRTFVRIKGKFEKEVWNSQLRYIHRVYWRNNEGFGTKGRLEMDHKLLPYAFMREFLELQYTEKSDGMDMYAGAILRARPGEATGWSLELLQCATSHPWDYKYVQFLARIRRSLFWKWLEIEVTPKAKYKRKDQWELEPSIECTFSIILDAKSLKQNNK